MLNKTENLENLQFWMKFCMFIGPVFAILTIICGFGYNYTTNRIKEIKDSVANNDNRSIFSFDSSKFCYVKVNATGLSYDKMIGFLFYDIGIVNNTKENITLKEVYFEFEYNGKKNKLESSVIATETLTTPNKKEKVTSLNLISSNKKNNLVLMEWINIREQINKGKVLLPGEVMKGSLVFISSISDFQEISKIENPVIRITEYSGWETRNLVTMPSFVNNHFLYIEKSHFEHY